MLHWCIDANLEDAAGFLLRNGVSSQVLNKKVTKIKFFTQFFDWNFTFIGRIGVAFGLSARDGRIGEKSFD